MGLENKLFIHKFQPFFFKDYANENENELTKILNTLIFMDNLNLLLVGENDVKNYVLKNLNEKALVVWQRAGFKDANVIAQYIANNVKLMQRNGVVKGAPPRTKMPQTDAFETSTNVINKLVKGSINFVNPEANLKESSNYNKRNIKITESQLRAMVRKELLNESKRRRF
jgi:hypothetical protein